MLNSHDAPWRYVNFKLNPDFLYFRSHNPWVVFFLKGLAYVLIFMYFIVPTVVLLNPWIIKEVVFLNRCKWPQKF